MSMENGMIAAVMNAARRLPRKSSRIIVTRIKPSNRFVLYRMDGAVNDKRLVVERNNLYSWRQPEACDPFLDQFDQLLAVTALEHDDHSGDGLAIAQCSALGWRRADVNIGHIAQKQRNAILRRS